MLTDVVLAVVVSIAAALSISNVDGHSCQIADNQRLIELHCSKQLRSTAARRRSDQILPGRCSAKHQVKSRPILAVVRLWIKCGTERALYGRDVLCLTPMCK